MRVLERGEMVRERERGMEKITGMCTETEAVFMGAVGMSIWVQSIMIRHAEGQGSWCPRALP